MIMQPLSYSLLERATSASHNCPSVHSAQEFFFLCCCPPPRSPLLFCPASLSSCFLAAETREKRNSWCSAVSCSISSRRRCRSSSSSSFLSTCKECNSSRTVSCCTDQQEKFCHETSPLSLIDASSFSTVVDDASTSSYAPLHPPC